MKNRKIDLMRNKDELLKIISKSILDPTRHHLSILEWGKLTNLDIVKEDYDHLMNLSLKRDIRKVK
jgi:predicted signal transduction protein with EAL and GGDEF domain